ncbi:MAG: SDR family NAD(P)-dependent oxidoreductase [Bacteroidia bacterium]
MNIIVTGASRGIGYELVKQFCIRGNNTVLAVSRKSEKLELLKKECYQLNSKSNVIPLAFDLSDENGIQSLVSAIKKEAGSIDILINNAGAIVNKPFLEISAADIEYVYNVNLFSVIKLIQGLLPAMNEKEKSHIVNISSMGGFQGSAKFAGLSAYSSSKSALACLTECLAEEFREKNIAFNCLALGAVQTEMLNEAFPGYKAPVFPSEMAGFIADFSLNAHKVLNGKIIPVSLSTP